MRSLAEAYAPPTGDCVSSTPSCNQPLEKPASGLAAAAGTVLAACSSGSGTPTGADGSFSVTVTGKEGPVTINSRPKRVAAVGYLRDTDSALALGAPLVGAAENTVFASVRQRSA